MSTAITCPDCGNVDQDKFAPAAKGKKVYCLSCHYSFVTGRHGQNTRNHNRRRSASEINIGQINFEISVLKNRIQFLELEKARILSGIRLNKSGETLTGFQR